MVHIQEISNSQISDDLMVKLTGRYYTDENVSRKAIRNLLKQIQENILLKKEMSIVDPFGGDGRLVCWFIEEWNTLNLPVVNWHIELWDITDAGFSKAMQRLNSLENSHSDVVITYNLKITDAFTNALNYKNKFDIVVTNPPWEILKPDSRELKNLSDIQKSRYVTSLKEYDHNLIINYPDSQPDKKFAGWGTNLSRVGLDVTMLITKQNGWSLIFLPASFFADEQSRKLRKKVFEQTQITDIAFYPAEAKLFGKADIDSATLIFSNVCFHHDSFNLTKYNKNLNIENIEKIKFEHIFINEYDYCIPMNIGPKGIKVLKKIRDNFEPWGNIEKNPFEGLWAGREVDETRIKEFLNKSIEGNKFIKGRMIDRYEIKEKPNETFFKESLKIPTSVKYKRIIWRDVSRSSQKRRLIATIVQSEVVAGNSLGVCYYKDNNIDALKILLGIMNSLCFEFQLRNYLATSHVSLSAIRKVCIPNRNKFLSYNLISEIVNSLLQGNKKEEAKLEAYIAKVVYGLSINEFKTILDSFEKIDDNEKSDLISQFNMINESRKYA